MVLNGACFNKCLLLYQTQGPGIKEKWLRSLLICEPGGHFDQTQAYILRPNFDLN